MRWFWIWQFKSALATNVYLKLITFLLIESEQWLRSVGTEAFTLRLPSLWLQERIKPRRHIANVGKKAIGAKKPLPVESQVRFGLRQSDRKDASPSSIAVPRVCQLVRFRPIGEKPF
jgi:hypothetical protein